MLTISILLFSAARHAVFVKRPKFIMPFRIAALQALFATKEAL
jgi:hypothetical protein